MIIENCPDFAGIDVTSGEDAKRGYTKSDY